MLTHPAELRIPLYHHVLIPRTTVKPDDPLARVITLHDVLKVMMSTHREERQSGDRSPRWVMRPYRPSDEEHISIVARLLDELCVPWPARTDPAHDALPGDDVMLAHLTRHAIVLSPLAKLYLSGLGDAGPGPRSLAGRHAAAMRLILAARTAQGAEPLSRETPELPKGVRPHHLLDIAWLERWLAPPDDDDDPYRS
ncbi:hypothetical protein HCN51_55065 [Nonomuraea sp. FMUSA5-5]|uniref:Uncharacterized protein n=1 Tax=Nonomuraea composti TaxID=2720023 RepID=A0ABX1BPR5_9ACTN|nr:hypothetical protein [Nonomuraea sp. FMUSA5-5]NJP98452.1 hypothetical protein [Nonomuraea sp. FMUSA5-5]